MGGCREDGQGEHPNPDSAHREPPKIRWPSEFTQASRFTRPSRPIQSYHKRHFVRKQLAKIVEIVPDCYPGFK
jgi:hypothetical protein